MKHLSDNELLIQISNQNEQALSQLYDRHAPKLLGLIFKIVHQREIAEDILQDTFLTVWQKSHTFNDSVGYPKAWLYSIARRKAIDVYRKQKRQPMQSDNFDKATQFVASDSNVAGTVERTLDDETVRESIKQLSVEQSEIINLAYFEGKTRREIARLIDTPLGTVNTRARLGLKNLQRILKRKGY